MNTSLQTSECITTAMFMAAESYSASSYGSLEDDDDECDDSE